MCVCDFVSVCTTLSTCLTDTIFSLSKTFEDAFFKNDKYVHMVAFFWHHLLGAMLRKLAFFKSRKYVHMVAFFIISRGDVKKIGDFQERKIRSHGSIFLASPFECDVETQTFFDNMGGAM